MTKLSMLSRAIAVTLASGLVLALSVGVAADTWPRQTGIDVEEYVFRISLRDDTDAIGGLATAQIRFVQDGVEEVFLDLVGRSGGAETGMEVAGVWVADSDAEWAAMNPNATAETVGAAANHSHVGERLRIRLAEAPAAGERRFITVAYEGQAATGLITGPNRYDERTFFSDNWPSKARNWLPTVDHVYEKARMQMVVTAPSHYQVVSNGLLMEETDVTPELRRTHWKQSVPIVPWLYMVGVARFAVDHLGVHRGVPIQTWVYHQDRDAGFYDFSYPTREALDFYSEWVGPYAYEKLANIQSASVGGGMEAATAILCGENSVTGTRSTRWRNVIIHEIAHQWFGNAVTEADWDDVWLSEGFATYFTSLYIEHAYGRDEFVNTMQRARDRIFDFYDTRPEYRIIHDNLADMGQVTTGMQYAKGSWVLHMLRHRIGTETYWEGIRRYYERYYNSHATTDDFRAVMEEVSGQDLEAFFQQWLYQGSAGLRLEGLWAYENSAVRLNLEQVQAGGTTYRMPVTIEFVDAEGGTERVDIEMTDTTQSFSIPVSFEPAEIVVDPDTWLLMQANVQRR
ncbi:MAG: M1 family peptidase [Acidobacteria bacterium]|nr:M1 family peptidase [Acidobacteriota bacterium]